MEVRKSYKKPKLYLNGVIKLGIPAFLVPETFFFVIWVICVASCHSFSRFFSQTEVLVLAEASQDVTTSEQNTSVNFPVNLTQTIHV